MRELSAAPFFAALSAEKNKRPASDEEAGLEEFWYAVLGLNQ